MTTPTWTDPVAEALGIVTDYLAHDGFTPADVPAEHPPRGCWECHAPAEGRRKLVFVAADGSAETVELAICGLCGATEPWAGWESVPPPPGHP